MRYAQIRKMDISNGEGIGVSLFVQGCPFHCKECFNQETWDFNNGKEWTNEIEENFIELIKKPYIKRVTFLGGEPMMYPQKLHKLVKQIKRIRNDINIWLYTGYTYEEIIYPASSQTFLKDKVNDIEMRRKLISKCDVLVDGRYIHELRDITLPFRGSSNQRIIDIKKSLKNGEVVLYETN